MKRLHVHLKVADLATNIEFYNIVFNAQPTVVKEDYAKWLLDDPRVNFSISSGVSEEKAGLEHLGIQVESEKELYEVYDNLKKAKGVIREEGKTVCCYAESEKSWIADPQGVEWEVFHTFGDSNTYYAEPKAEEQCCMPKEEAVVANEGKCC